MICPVFFSSVSCPITAVETSDAVDLSPSLPVLGRPFAHLVVVCSHASPWWHHSIFSLVTPARPCCLLPSIMPSITVCQSNQLSTLFTHTSWESLGYRHPVWSCSSLTCHRTVCEYYTKWSLGSASGNLVAVICNLHDYIFDIVDSKICQMISWCTK